MEKRQSNQMGEEMPILFVKSPDKIAMNEAIEFALKDGLLCNFADGTFGENLEVTLGVFAKLVYLFERRNGKAGQLDNSVGTGVFDKYIEYLKSLRAHMEEAINIDMDIDFLPLQGDSSQSLSKRDVFVFIRRLYYYNFKTLIPDVSKSTLSSNEFVTRGWIAQLMYYCALSIVGKILEECDECQLQSNSPSWWQVFYKRGYGMIPYLIMDRYVAELAGAAKVIIYIFSHKNLCFEEDYDLFIRMNKVENWLKKLQTKLENKEIKNTPNSRIVYHYTSLRALKNILDESGEAQKNANIEWDELWRQGIKQMRMTNSEFLNDPDEGILLQEYYSEILQEVSPELSKKGKNREDTLEPREQYVISLNCQKDERLPMWSLYGDRGQGCRIEFEILEPAKFHRICYIGKKEEADVKQSLQHIAKVYNSYCRSKASESDQEILKGWIDSELKMYGYYFKKADYGYEHETRAVRWGPIPNIHRDEADPSVDAFSKLYTYIDTPLRIRSILLGPKCKNPKGVAAILKYYYQIPEVKISQIHFQ